MKSLIALIFFLSLTLKCHAQKLIIPENGSTYTVEFFDGNEWAYMTYNGVNVGISCHKTAGNYGEFYKIELILENKTGDNILFDPNYVQAYMLDKKSEVNVLKVYTFEDFCKKISNKDSYLKLTNTLGAFGAAFEKKTVLYSLSGNVYTYEKTEYNSSKAAQANANANMQNMAIEQNTRNYIAEIDKLYLKKNTIHNGDILCGYMNIQKKKGEVLNVIVPIGNDKYTFQWNLSRQ